MAHPLFRSFASRTSRTGRTGLMTVRTFIFCGLVLLAVPVFAFSFEPPATAFDSANKLYDQGKYAEAATAYEKLLLSGQSSPALLFNLGNAQFKAGQMGQAIYSYRRAAQFTPRDPDLRANLQFARNQIQGPTFSPNKLQVWLARLTLNEWTFLAAAAFWSLLILLTLLQWRPALKPLLRNWMLAVGAAFVLLAFCFAAALHQDHFTQAAIVATRDLPVRQGPFDESQTAFTAHDGAELGVLDKKDDWLQVCAEPQRIGWLKRKDVRLIPGV